MKQVLARRLLALSLLTVLAGTGTLRAETGTIEKIEVQGLVRLTQEGFRHVLAIQEGDPYDPAKLRAAFRRLWDLKLFRDLKIEAEPGPAGGKILIIKVVERPSLVSVKYEDNKVLTRTQIEDRLKEKKIDLKVGGPLDEKTVYAVETTIRDYLGEKGYLDGAVRHELHEVTQTSYSVEFFIRPGGKTRIRKIDFSGNKVFSDGKLKKQLTLTREWKWYWPWSSKNLYHPVKWDQDVGAVREAYQDLGFLDVEIKPPIMEVKEVVKAPKAKKEKRPEPEAAAAPETGSKPPTAAAAPSPEGGAQSLSAEEAAKLAKKQRKAEEKARKQREKADKQAEREKKKAEPKVKRWVYLSVPIVEGKQYKTGKVTVTGNKVLSDGEILSLVPLREGSILSNGVLKAGVDAIKLAYGNRGYLYATAVRQIQRREGEPVGDVEIAIDEDKAYYVARIEFSGNTTTEDKVLRREVRVNEGDLFNRSLLDLSKTKLNQLGYFEIRDDPVVEPIEGENRVRITFSGEEKGRNEIQVGGGYSGLDGAFFTGNYATRNFLGKGEIVSLSAQIGGSREFYSLQFLEPWFLNRPYSLGFNLFKSSTDYSGSLRSSGRGAGARVGRLFGYFLYGELAFDWENVTTTGFVSGGAAQNRISSLTPSANYNRVNNPYRPSRGWSLGIRAQFAGGFLGGDTSFFRPIARYSGYRRATRRTFFGFHSELGMIRPVSGNSIENTATVNGIPASQRFWIGGDVLGPRVFETRSISPLRFVSLDPLGRIQDITDDPIGDPVRKWDRNGDGVVNAFDLVELGGNRFYLLQAEYVFPLNQTVELAAFADFGNSLYETTPWGFTGLRVSTGIELRLYLPVFPVPLRLIYGKAIQQEPGDRTNSFTFSIGRSF